MIGSEHRRRHIAAVGVIAAGLTLFQIQLDLPFESLAAMTSPEGSPTGSFLRVVSLGDRFAEVAPWLFFAAIQVASFGLYFATWRWTRNRAVSIASALLFGVHPQFLHAIDRSLLDGAVVAFLATWAFAFQLRAAPTAPRLANRPPSRFRLAVFLVLCLASVFGSTALVLAPALIAFDLVVNREGRRRGRAWKSYLPYLFAWGLTAAIASWGHSSWPPSGESLFWFALFPDSTPNSQALFPALMLTPTIGLFVEVCLIALAVVVIASDIALDFGARRALFRYGAPAAAWFLGGLGATFLPIGPGAGPVLFVVPVVFVAVLLWRIVMTIFPEPDHQASGQTYAVQSWSDLQLSLGISGISDAKRLEPAVSTPLPPAEGLSPALFREHIRPLIPEGAILLEWTPPGDFSPYSGTLVALGRVTHLLVPTLDGGGLPSDEFRGIDGVEVCLLPMNQPWSLAGLDVDFAAFPFGLGGPQVAAQTLDALVATLRPSGRLAGFVPHEEQARLDLDDEALALFGLKAVTTHDVPGGLILFGERKA